MIVQKCQYGFMNGTTLPEDGLVLSIWPNVMSVITLQHECTLVAELHISRKLQWDSWMKRHATHLLFCCSY